MLQIEDTIISFDVLDKKFLCNLLVCKGACCVEGDAGAPLEWDEIDKIEALLPDIIDDLSEASKEVISKQGVFYFDIENEPVTSIVNGRECVFTYTDENGICKCAIEKAYKAGKTDFQKPISCHLYPIRVQKYNTFRAVNYHHWNICNCGVTLGNEQQLPVYRFLKEPLIRKFGADWFEQLDIAARELKR